MKKYYLRWTAVLFAGLSLAMASCNDSDDNGSEPKNPIFPETVEAAIMAGDSYTLRFETNMDWTATIPADVAQTFYIEDGSQKTLRTQGKAGAAEVTIGCYEIENFDDDPTCEVTLTMGQESKVIATLTIDKQERTLTLRTSKMEDGNFVYNSEEGLRYEYEAEPAERIDLAWPAGNSGYMYPIVVEANFAWRLAEKSEWIAEEDYVGEAGQQVEILLRADPTKYPLDGDNEGKFVLCARNNADMKYEYKVTIPACRDHFAVTGFAAESRFNAKGLFFSAGSSSAGAWVEGGAHGNIVSVEEPVIYKFAEVTEGGMSYLEAEESKTSWIKVASTLSDEENVLKDRRYTITVEENTGDDARKGVILALPKSVAATLGGAWELAEMDIKEEYQQYIVTRVNQAAKPDLVSAVNPEGMAEVGAALERLDADNYGFIMEGFGVTDGFNLIYTAAWSNEDSTLAFERQYTSYKCYDYDWNEMNAADSWLSVRNAANGTVIDMDPTKDKCGNSSQMSESVAHAGFIVFADAEGDFVVIRCVYDENASIGGGDGAVKVAFQHPDYATQFDGSTLELLTSGELFDEYDPGNGAPVYHLTYYKPYATMSGLTGLNGMAMGISNDEEWLSYEPGDGAITVSMNADALGTEKKKTNSIVFYNSSWETAVVLVCTLDLTNYTEED